MTENDIYDAVIAVLEAGLAARSLSVTVDVRRGNQPRVVGLLTDPSVLLYNLGTYRYGSVRREDAWDGVNMVHTETQAMEVTLQCGALAPPAPPPAVLPPYAAADLVNIAASILQADAGRLALSALGFGVERIGQIRQPTFTDDTDQFQASPSFDFVLAYNQVDISQSPVIAAKELDVIPV